MENELTSRDYKIKDYIFVVRKCFAHELAVHFGCSERCVRLSMNRLRANGYMVGCGDSGYYIIEDYETYEKTRRRLRATAMNLLVTIRAMDRTCKDKFGIQLDLDLK